MASHAIESLREKPALLPSVLPKRSRQESLLTLPNEIIVTITQYLSVRELCCLSSVCKALQNKLYNRSVWHSVLQDIRDAKPRSHQPVLSTLSIDELRQRAVFEARLDQQFSSSFVGKHLHTIESMIAVPSAQFIPNSGGRFITCAVGGELRLYSPQGQLIDILSEVGPSLPSSHLWIRPLSLNSWIGVQLSRTASYRDFAHPGVVRVIRIQDTMEVVTVISTKTPPISADALGNTIAFTCHGDNQQEHLKLHVYHLTSNPSEVCVQSSVFLLQRPGPRVSQRLSLAHHAHKYQWPQHPRLPGGSMVILDECRMLLVNEGGLVAYSLPAGISTGNDPVVLRPYWSEATVDGQGPCLRSSPLPLVAVVHETRQCGRKRIAVFGGKDLCIVDVPLSALSTEKSAIVSVHITGEASKGTDCTTKTLTTTLGSPEAIPA